MHLSTEHLILGFWWLDHVIIRLKLCSRCVTGLCVVVPIGGGCGSPVVVDCNIWATITLALANIYQYKGLLEEMDQP